MEVINKTLIGKNGYLFLNNDANQEIKIHNENLCVVDERNLDKYTSVMNKFIMIVFPDKSFFCREHLPDGYNMIFRPGFEIYKRKFGDNIIDGTTLLRGIDQVFYKTDTHLNLKGAYIVYVNFINKINKLFNMGVICKSANLYFKDVNSLCELNNGLGDLTWHQNLGDQILTNTNDTVVLSDDIKQIYTLYEFAINDPLKLLLFQGSLIDDTNNNIGKKLDWIVISKYILYKKNDHLPKCKILIFYDSFLLSTLSLYLELTSEVYMSKSIFNKSLVDYINPDYIFEFRVERFLI
jgi:hypothetical protein